MARGYEGQFGRKLNAPYIFIPMCVLFLLPFFDPRRPFRMVHLDLLVLLAFAASHFYFNEGDIDMSVPLAYPPMVYLLVRMLWIGFRPRERAQPLVPYLPLAAVALDAAVPGRLPGGAEHRRRPRDRRGLRGGDRRRPDRRRRPALRRRRVAQGHREGRHVRTGQLPGLPAVGAGDAVDGQLGRPARRARARR